MFGPRASQMTRGSGKSSNVGSFRIVSYQSLPMAYHTSYTLCYLSPSRPMPTMPAMYTLLQGRATFLYPPGPLFPVHPSRVPEYSFHVTRALLSWDTGIWVPSWHIFQSRLVSTRMPSPSKPQHGKKVSRSRDILTTQHSDSRSSRRNPPPTERHAEWNLRHW